VIGARWPYVATVTAPRLIDRLPERKYLRGEQRERLSGLPRLDGLRGVERAERQVAGRLAVLVVADQKISGLIILLLHERATFL
jgi:hypothetical protein